MRSYKLKDYKGVQIGFLTIVDRYEPSLSDTASTAKWTASCLCGGTIVLEHKEVSGKKKTTCGCGLQVRSLKYLPGNRFGKLVIVSNGDTIKHGNGNTTRQLWCRCDCGNPELTLVRANNLQSGNTTSCGCVGEESRKTHGLSHTRTYSIHESMLRRCKPELADKFPYHAGRGVKVCSRWNPKLGGSFENFLADMGEAPENMSLDRIDVNGDYEPSNCRWATNSVQGYNKNLDPNNTSGKTGVSFYTHCGKWSAEIHVDGKHIRLGMFDSFQRAVEVRKRAELQYYGWNKT